MGVGEATVEAPAGLTPSSNGSSVAADAAASPPSDLLEQLAFVAFCVAVVLSPFRGRFMLAERVEPLVYVDFTSFLLFWSDIAGLAVLALWVTSLISRKQLPSFGPVFVKWPVGVLLVTVWLSTITSIDPALSTYAALRITCMIALAIYALNELGKPERLLPAVATMIAIQVSVAVGQVLSQSSLGWKGLGEHSLDPTIGGVSVITSSDGDRLLRGYGLADHPNILGGVLGFGLLVLITSLPRINELARGIATGVVAFGAMAMALTFSRGAAIAFAIGFVIAVGLLVARRLWQDLGWWLVAACVGLLALVTVVVPYRDFYYSRVNATAFEEIATEQRSLSERDALVEVTNDLIIAKPLLGTGAGTAALAISEELPDFEFNYQPAHVVLLVVAAEGGLVAALAYSGLIVAPAIAVLVRRRSLDARLIGASALLAAVTLVGFVDYYTWSYASGQFWFWVALGSWSGAYQRLGDD